MKQLTKAQITIGILSYFAIAGILIEQAKIYPDPLVATGIILLLLLLMLVLSYIILAILQWIDIFDLKTNAIITLIVLTTMMIYVTLYIKINPLA